MTIDTFAVRPGDADYDRARTTIAWPPGENHLPVLAIDLENAACEASSIASNAANRQPVALAAFRHRAPGTTADVVIASILRGGPIAQSSRTSLSTSGMDSGLATSRFPISHDPTMLKCPGL